MTELPEGWSAEAVRDVVGPRGVFTDGDWIESKDQDPKGEVVSAPSFWSAGSSGVAGSAVFIFDPPQRGSGW